MSNITAESTIKEDAKKMLEKEFLRTPHLEKIKILWHSGYYDGVLSGVLLYQNKPCWFEHAEEQEDRIYNEETGEYDDGPTGNWYRKFWVYDLDHDSTVRLFAQHGLWQGHVGLHSDYFPFNGRRVRITTKNTKKNMSIDPLHYGGVSAGSQSGRDQTYWNIWEKSRDLLESKIGKFDKTDCIKIGWIFYDQLFADLPGPGEEIDIEK